MNINRLLLLLSLCLFTIGPTRAAERPFDQWADDFAARWVRLYPQFATMTQYFTGAEQDALDRQLILGAFGQTYGVKAAQERAEFARRGWRSCSASRPQHSRPSSGHPRR
jgi:hypothetical protein